MQMFTVHKMKILLLYTSKVNFLNWFSWSFLAWKNIFFFVCWSEKYIHEKCLMKCVACLCRLSDEIGDHLCLKPKEKQNILFIFMGIVDTFSSISFFFISFYFPFFLLFFFVVVGFFGKKFQFFKFLSDWSWWIWKAPLPMHRIKTPLEIIYLSDWFLFFISGIIYKSTVNKYPTPFYHKD